MIDPPKLSLHNGTLLIGFGHHEIEAGRIAASRINKLEPPRVSANRMWSSSSMSAMMKSRTRDLQRAGSQSRETTARQRESRAWLSITHTRAHAHTLACLQAGKHSYSNRARAWARVVTALPCHAAHTPDHRTARLPCEPARANQIRGRYCTSCTLLRCKSFFTLSAKQERHEHQR